MTSKVSGMLVSPTHFERVWEDEKRRQFSGSELCPDPKEFVVFGEKDFANEEEFFEIFIPSQAGA